MFWRASPLLHMLNQFRVCWVMGSYGGGKTLACYEFAYELYQTGRYRYILGNSNSVWTDNPEKVKLRDGSFVDGLLIMDEGGLFMHLNSDADKFMLGLRKLNITILVPSVIPPSSRIKYLTVQRVLNGQSFGIPFWLYNYRLNLGTEKEKDYFGIYKPQEMYGIYDTIDYPIDDLYLSDWLYYWMQTARSSRPAWATWGAPPKLPGERRARRARADTDLDQLRGIVENFADSQDEISDALSVYAFEGSEKRRKYRR